MLAQKYYATGTQKEPDNKVQHFLNNFFFFILYTSLSSSCDEGQGQDIGGLLSKCEIWNSFLGVNSELNAICYCHQTEAAWII